MSANLADDELLIVRTFNAPAALVFAMWTQAEHFRRWMGPAGHECTAFECDLRVGGRYRGMIESAEHGESWFGGIYQEIEPPKRLVFTYAWENGPSANLELLTVIEFREEQGRTTQIFHQSGFRERGQRDRHVGGWSSTFERAAAYVENQAGVQRA